MDHNIPRWLKDELGLAHMSEADLNSLMFHPRHGGLCRRLVKFLADSTLCSQRFPNVYVKEDYDDAMRGLAFREELLGQTIDSLRTQMRTCDASTREVNFLTEKLVYLSSIVELQQKSAEAFETIASRADLNIEQVSTQIKNRGYFNNQDLESLYQEDIPNDLDISVTTRLMSSAEKELEGLTTKAETMHLAISTLLQSINKSMAGVDVNLGVRNTNVEELAAFKIPDFEEVILDADPNGKNLKEQGDRLLEELSQLNQQVIELSEQYTCRKNEINNVYKEELGKNLNLLKKLQECEAALHNQSDK